MTPVVAIDIGSSNVKVVVGERRPNGLVEILGVSSAPSEGVRQGEVCDVLAARASIEKALLNAEEASNVTIREGMATVNGAHVHARMNSIRLPVAGASNQISEADIRQARKLASLIHPPPQNDSLHEYPAGFQVDDQQQTGDPIGLFGSTLSCRQLSIYGRTSSLLNTLSLFKFGSVAVDTVAFAGCCAATAVVPTEQRQEGALLIDLGGGTSCYVLFRNGCLVDAGCISGGSDDITYAIAETFNIPMKAANDLKEQHGNAVANLSDDAPLPVNYDSGDLFHRRIRQAELDGVINVKLSEILFAIRSRIHGASAKHRLGGGVMLCGGGARLKNLPVLASKVFATSATLAGPSCVLGRLPADAYEFAAAVGLTEEELDQPPHPVKAWLHQAWRWFSKE